MTNVTFYDSVEDERISFSVIVAKTADGRWVFCKHRDRITLESPGGRREKGESPIETAKRELHEETGAVDYSIMPICVYSVQNEKLYNGKEIFGLLCYAEIKSFEKELHCEMECVIITDELTDNWTYPEVQLKLIEELQRRNIL